MDETPKDVCGKCGAEIDPSRRVDFTLKDGTRVCESCFVKGTRKASSASWSSSQHFNLAFKRYFVDSLFVQVKIGCHRLGCERIGLRFLPLHGSDERTT
jgi:hypothetical protein